MKMWRFALVTCALGLALAVALAPERIWHAVAQGSGAGVESNDESRYPSISADGRYVVFESDASNLVSGDTNGWADVFVHDRQTGETTLVSVASDGAQTDSPSIYHSAISTDGRFVAFESCASNLVSGDTNGQKDVFVHDRQMRQTTRVSITSDGVQGDRGSERASISADGRYVAFESWASNLVNEDTNGYGDVFVHDRQTGETTLVSVASDGTQAGRHSGHPSISADGRYVAFESWASNLVNGDTNGYGDVFVHDRQTGETTLVSVASDGTPGDTHSDAPSISADGRYVAFESWAGNLVSGDTNGWPDVFVHDRQTGETTLVSVASDGTQADRYSGYASISADGRYVTFGSYSNDLVSGDSYHTDVFVHDRQTGETSLVSVASDGTQGDYDSGTPSISGDGRHVAFVSGASNLVSGDTDDHLDIFVHDRQTGETTRVSVGSGGGPAPYVGLSVEPDGDFLASDPGQHGGDAKAVGP